MKNEFEINHKYKLSKTAISTRNYPLGFRGKTFSESMQTVDFLYQLKYQLTVTQIHCPTRTRMKNILPLCWMGTCGPGVS